MQARRRDRIRPIVVAHFIVTAGVAGAQPPPSDVEPPTIEHQPVAHVPAGQAVEVAARIQDPSGVFAPSVHVRPRGKVEYDAIDMRPRDGRYVAIIPAEQVAGDIEYFIEAFDTLGNGPARAGGPDRPFAASVYDPTKVPPPAAPQPGDAATMLRASPEDEPDDDGGVGWWIWAVVGAAVAGGAVAVYFAVRPPSEVDFVDVLVSGSDPTGGL